VNSPQRGYFSSTCQQPGSPGRPQQFRKYRILIQLFLMKSSIFFGQDISIRRFVKKDRGLGPLFFTS